MPNLIIINITITIITTTILDKGTTGINKMTIIIIITILIATISIVSITEISHLDMIMIILLLLPIQITLSKQKTKNLIKKMNLMK